jgi:uncharacterized SAM-binding protein YcdF (DUF218 family)
MGSRRKWFFALSTGGLVVLIAFATKAGGFLIVDSPQPSDIIVVLAGETDVRPAHALQLLQQGYAQRVLIDVPASAKIYKFTQMQLAQDYVQSSTRDEARDVERCLDREQGSKVLIVTSDFHTRRSLSIFRHEIPGRSFSVAAARDATQFGSRWWTHRQWSKTCIDEWLRLLWWNAVERWH